MKKLLLVLLLFSACKKETVAPQMTVVSQDPWNGTYTLQSTSCSLPSYESSEVHILVIDNKTIGGYGLNEYLYNPVHLSITGDFAEIPKDEMTQADQNAGGWNSWDFQGGSIKKQGTTLVANYSFVIYYDNGMVKDRPVFISTYRK